MDPTIINNFLCPEVVVASDGEVEAHLKRFKLSKALLPLIFSADPAVLHLKAPVGSVVKSLRNSPVTGKTEPYFRLVVD